MMMQQRDNGLQLNVQIIGRRVAWQRIIGNALDVKFLKQNIINLSMYIDMVNLMNHP